MSLGQKTPKFKLDSTQYILDDKYNAHRMFDAQDAWKQWHINFSSDFLSKMIDENLYDLKSETAPNNAWGDTKQEAINNLKAKFEKSFIALYPEDYNKKIEVFSKLLKL